MTIGGFVMNLFSIFKAERMTRVCSEQAPDHSTRKDGNGMARIHPVFAVQQRFAFHQKQPVGLSWISDKSRPAAIDPVQAIPSYPRRPRNLPGSINGFAAESRSSRADPKVAIDGSHFVI